MDEAGAAAGGGELERLREEIALLTLQRGQLLARVTAKDAEFSKERESWKRERSKLLTQIKEMRDAK